MGFHLRIHDYVIAGIVFHKVKDSVVGAARDDAAKVRCASDFGFSEEALPIDAEDAGDGGFTGNGFRDVKIVGIELKIRIGISHAVIVGVAASEEEACNSQH